MSLSLPFNEGDEAPAGRDVLFDKVVAGGFCIGCGNCAFASGGAIAMELNDEGFVVPRIVAANAPDAPELTATCPFSNATPDETELAETLPWAETAHDPRVGHYVNMYAGHVVDNAFRLGGGSGGVTTWFLRTLLESGEVDHVLHVKPIDPTTDSEGRLFRYGLSSTADELMSGRKSRYYPVDLAEVYRIITERPGRYAVVAVPCFAKALRLMQRQSPVISERVHFIIGLVCGHLKSRAFGEYLAWMQGIRPQELRRLDFRVKLPGADASQYTVRAEDANGQRTGVPLKDYFGTTWDLGFMKYGACEYCDDIFAETADIVFGDAWIQPFQESWMGSNIVLTRHPVASRLVQQGVASGALALTPIGLDQMVKSQASGLRHRREGLAHRLKLLDQAERWRPRKRFEVAKEPSSQRKRVYEMRTGLATATARAFARYRDADGVERFQRSVSLDVFRYYLLAFGLKQAVIQSAPAKWLRRRLKRR